MIDLVQPQAERVSVLMVDDRPENLLALKAILRRNDYRLVEAESGYEALGRVRDEDFAVILLDVMMPCMSGIEFAAELRRGLHNRDTPIIFLTAMVADNQLIHEAYAAGAVDFLVKPLDPVLVQAKVAAFAELYRHKRTIEKQAEALAAGAKHQRLVLDKALEAFIAMDSQGQIVEWNQQAEITFGWRRGEVMGRLLADTIIPQRYREAHNRGLKHFLETGKGPVLNRRFEIFACDRSSREMPVELTITPIEFDGKFVFNAFLHDITAAKRLERLRETQLRLTRLLTERQSIGDIAPRLLEAICEGIGWDIGELWWEEKDSDCLECKAIWCLPNHNISEFVAVSRRMKFAKGSGLPGKVWETGDSLWISDISQDQNFPRARVALEAGIRAAFSIPIKVGEMTHGVAAFYSRENQEPDAPLLELAADLGSRVGLFAQRREAEDELQRFSRDLERRVAERTQALEEANKALEEANKKLASESTEREKLYIQAQRANRLKDEFLTTVSHELRTPMNVILGWTEMMRSGEGVNDQKTILETIYRNSKALTGIIDDLLDVSRIISGKLELSVKTVEISEIVEDVTRGMRLACESKGVAMRTVLDPSVGPISGDQGRLHQVVWNLMSNAVKFTPKGGSVELVLRRVQSSVELTVRDSGVGILPEFIPYVFDRFRQEDSTSTRRYGGLGIGLAITRQLVELHGGHISASSDGKGQGSTFTVTLPLMAVRLMPAQDKNTAGTVESETTSWSAGNRKALVGIKVLVVDDSPDVLLLVGAVLRKYGAKVVVASSAAEGLRVLEEENPDVLLSDISMPDEDGLVLIQNVRSFEARKGRGQTPAAALTAHAHSEVRGEMLKAGFQLHLPKPIDARALVTAVAGLAGRVATDHGCT